VRKDAVVFGVAGIFFGLLVGWIIGSQASRGAAVPGQPAPQAAAAPAQAAPQLDESRVAALRRTAEENPRDAETRVALGNLYFDAERFEEASRWYADALAVDPNDVNASTDLGIAYYYLNQPDKALAQFERSLAIDPSHSKTLLNTGIVRAFGKQDLKGAAEAWQRVLEVAPANSQEAAAARQALEGLRSAHPEIAGGSSGAANRD
jgi:tetratricopeptide (TPR) repeat protein